MYNQCISSYCFSFLYLVYETEQTLSKKYITNVPQLFRLYGIVSRSEVPRDT